MALSDQERLGTDDGVAADIDKSFRAEKAALADSHTVAQRTSFAELSEHAGDLDVHASPQSGPAPQHDSLPAKTVESAVVFDGHSPAKTQVPGVRHNDPATDEHRKGELTASDREEQAASGHDAASAGLAHKDIEPHGCVDVERVVVLDSTHYSNQPFGSTTHNSPIVRAQARRQIAVA
jgi:hypothetical protein